MKKKKEITFYFGDVKVPDGPILVTATDPRTYAFPTKSRCPRCRSTRTTRTGASGDKQYRTCAVPRCGWKYTVTGTLI
jgi:hypothetical protein